MNEKENTYYFVSQVKALTSALKDITPLLGKTESTTITTSPDWNAQASIKALLGKIQQEIERLGTTPPSDDHDPEKS
jgi:hypothetical protein